jgi:hypothetical protein
MSAYQHPDLVALDEIEDLLEAYAEARLSPSGPLLNRMRRAVMTRAAANEATNALQRRAPAGGGRRGPLFALPRIRIPAAAFALGFAVVLGAGTGAAVLAAPAGSPLFNARIALEQLFLPVELDARLAAHEEHLAARLSEAEAAAARGDSAGLAAALTAFDAEVALAVSEIGEDADRLAHLETMLSKHVAILTALQAKVPEQAAIENALANSQKAIVKVKEKKDKSKTPRTHPPSGPQGNPEGERTQER